MRKAKYIKMKLILLNTYKVTRKPIWKMVNFDWYHLSKIHGKKEKKVGFVSNKLVKFLFITNFTLINCWCLH